MIYSLMVFTWVSAKNHSISPSSVHYWINELSHTKHREPLIVITEEEEVDVLQSCKNMDQLGHGLELIKLKSITSQIDQGRQNSFKYGFLGKSWLFGFKKRHPNHVLCTTKVLDIQRVLNLHHVIVSNFYNIIFSAYDKHNYAP